MRFHIMSDLHMEFAPFDYVVPDPVPDVLVLAGDIVPGVDQPQLRGLIDQAFSTGVVSIVMVPGNHEGYHYKWEDVIKAGRRLEREYPGFFFLDCDYMVFPDKKTCLFGGAMWTNMCRRDPLVMENALWSMNDYNLITYKGRRLNPSDTVDMHDEFIAKLRSVRAAKNEGTKLVVVSHHAPSVGSIDIKYAARKGTGMDRMNYCFYSALEYEMDGVDLWFHGHTHSPADYFVGDTRVVCNPRGYPGEPGNRFNPTMVVEV